ncbi:MAG: S8 family serine peptidase, partial [Victivallales bacterium]|nr:S8 family serine peptidase [Victivallales bacterium]
MVDMSMLLHGVYMKKCLNGTMIRSLIVITPAMLTLRGDINIASGKSDMVRFIACLLSVVVWAVTLSMLSYPAFAFVQKDATASDASRGTNVSADVFAYAPGEIIVKFTTDQLRTTGGRTPAISKIGSFDVSGVSFEPVFPVLPQIKRSGTISAAAQKQREMTLEKSQEVGLDRIYRYESPTLRKKAETFQEAFRQAYQRQKAEQSLIGESREMVIRFQTADFGVVAMRIRDSIPIIDPYTQQMLDALRQEPGVEYAELNRSFSFAAMPAEPLFADQWSLHNTGQPYHTNSTTTKTGRSDADINFLETYGEAGYRQGDGVVVAVIDSGLGYVHEDIDDNLWVNQGEIPAVLLGALDADSDGHVSSREILEYFEANTLDFTQDGAVDFHDVLHEQSPFINGIDDELNGYTDDLIGYDLVSHEKAEDGLAADSGADYDPYDWHGHGTHVSGTIAAEENGIGIIGVAPRSRIMTVRGLNSSGGMEDDLSAAIYYAVNNGADILNCSWGGEGESALLKDAFDYAWSMEVLSIAAAGNNDRDVRNSSPASLESVIAVGAWNAQGLRSEYSNYGAMLDVSAPGEEILSLLSPESWASVNYESSIVQDAYIIFSGTSMASPHIAGMLAGLKSSVASTELTPQRAKELLQLSPKTPWFFPQSFTEDFGYGAVDLAALFSLKDLETAYPAITKPAHAEHISGILSIEATINGVYDNIQFHDAAGQNLCMEQPDSLSCSINMTGLPENTATILEMKAYNASGHLIGRDAVLPIVDNLQLVEETPRLLYCGNTDIPLTYSIASNGASFQYWLRAYPYLRNRSPLLVASGSGTDTIHEHVSVPFGIVDLPNEYRLELEVYYAFIAGGTSTQHEENNLYVDTGIHDAFPVQHETGSVFLNAFPMQILNMDADETTKEIYLPMEGGSELGNGWYRMTSLI